MALSGQGLLHLLQQQQPHCGVLATLGAIAAAAALPQPPRHLQAPGLLIRAVYSRAPAPPPPTVPLLVAPSSTIWRRGFSWLPSGWGTSGSGQPPPPPPPPAAAEAAAVGLGSVAAGPPPAAAAGTTTSQVDQSPIQGPLASPDAWWAEACRSPFQFRWSNPDDPTPGAKGREGPALPQRHMTAMQKELRQAVDASFDLTSFLVGARLAISHVMHSVLCRDAAALTPCVSRAVAAAATARLMSPVFAYEDASGTAHPCPASDAEATAKVWNVLPRRWGLLPAALVAQLDPERAAWPSDTPNAAPPPSAGVTQQVAGYQQQQQQEQQAEPPDPPHPQQHQQPGGPHWCVIEVEARVQFIVTLRGVAALAQRVRIDDPVTGAHLGWSSPVGNQVMRWYLARGPVPPHPGEPWAAEPWFVAAVLSHVPLRMSELLQLALEHPLSDEEVAKLPVQEERGRQGEGQQGRAKGAAAGGQQGVVHGTLPVELGEEMMEVAAQWAKWRGRDMS